MERTFETPGPLDLVVEVAEGDLRIEGADTATTTVRVEGPEDAVAETRVELVGSTLRVIGPKGLGTLFRRGALDVRVVLPADSRVRVKAGSADVGLHGRLGDAAVATGSGDVRADGLSGHGVLTTGSGDVTVGSAGSLEARSGSGDVLVRETAGASRVRSGSGALVVEGVGGDLDATTGSGSVTLGVRAAGRVRVRTGSGDVAVRVAPGLPVWTDIRAGGRVSSTMAERGAPREGAAYVDLGVVVGSGSVRLADA